MSKNREIWIDALRGVTVTLVVLHHCRLAVTTLLRQAGTDFHNLVDNVDDLIGLVRIPAFLICSGIVFSGPAQRGWRWFVGRRLGWTLWIALVWGWLQLAVMYLGVPLYPWLDGNLPTRLNLMLLDPVGNMWFIYAIALLGTFCMILRPAGKTVTIAAAALLSALIIETLGRMDLPPGLHLTAWNLGIRGFMFFALGFVFAQQLKQPRRGHWTTFVVAILIWAGCYLLYLNAETFRSYHRLALAIPATLAAIHMLQFLLARLPQAAEAAAFLGRRSLEIFLLHQFFVAACFMLLRPLAGTVPGLGILAIMFAATLLASVAAAGLLRGLPGNPMFSTRAMAT
ncbi:acyltransferase family protein [Paracoccus rhizosphaerae]|uniref:Acyltransferase family protein n=1 Tax=Paracoccus rhizosphaerae TaxID=1133347 RepID=A0ABV6CLR2_9RHOB|nr:acyltransferase [Paracoccus rhizosphaerae]